MQMSDLLAAALLSSSALAEPLLVEVHAAATTTREPRFTSTRVIKHPTMTISDVSIPSGFKCKLRDTLELRSYSVFRVEGSFFCDAQEGAVLSFDSFSSGPHSFFIVKSPGDLKVEHNGELLNGVGALYHATAQADLEVFGSSLIFANEGMVDLRADNRLMFFHRGMFKNLGDIHLVSGGVGEYFFGNIYNAHFLEVRAASSNDILEFNNLQNDGSLAVHYGKGEKSESDDVIAHGRIDNLGSIRVEASSGIGLIRHDEEITNRGLICLRRTFLLQRADITGDGCIYVAKFGYFEIDGSKYLDEAQKLVLGDKSAYIVIRNLGVIRRKTYKLHGVSSGSRFIHSRSVIAKVKYDGEEGLLHVIHNNRSKITFNVGCGYSLLGFRARRNTVSYNGENPPSTGRKPALCKCW